MKNNVKLDAEAWSLRFNGISLRLTPPRPVGVSDEIYENLPLFRRDAAPWSQGRPLRGIAACEGCQTGALDPASVKVRSESGGWFLRGRDYDLDPFWGVIGRLENGRIGEGESVRISYRCFPSRLDSVVRDSAGCLRVVRGCPAVTLPEPPPLEPGEARMLNIFFHGDCARLTESMLYPVQEAEACRSVLPRQSPPPEFMEKLLSGKKVRILAWGDSVTEGKYLPEKDRWQNQFAAALSALYPHAEIELETLGWGGRTMSAFFDEPPGSPYHFQEHVLGRKPDLVISEFVNDAGLPPEKWHENFERALSDFRGNGMEWVILTPHYVRSDWMNFPDPSEPSEDPRPYVRFIREFARKHRIPLADASLLYGHLRKEGIPYEILLANGINHPDRRGMALFSRALLELFRPPCGENAEKRGKNGIAEKKNTISDKEHER